MDSQTAFAALPPDLFDTTTLISLSAVVILLGVAYGVSLQVLHPSTANSYRFLFIWHAFDALIHFFFEGSFLYHCFFSSLSTDSLTIAALREASFHPTPSGFPFGSILSSSTIYGSQAGGTNPFAQLWMVYARADKRWAGADLGVISLEILTVFVVGPMAVWVCWDIARRNARANVVMIILATAELYGGFMTFCPEWLTGNQFLDGSNFMYLWVYLVFFNMLWVFIPIYAIYVSWNTINAAFATQTVKVVTKKTK